MGEVGVAQQVVKDVYDNKVPASVVSRRIKNTPKLKELGFSYGQQQVRYHRRRDCTFCATRYQEQDEAA